jgi:hypothetical protein
MKLKRFAESKQKQVDQFIAYAKLCGFSGSDLVSIGGKMTREDVKERVRQNLDIVENYTVYGIGNRPASPGQFKIKTVDGTYNFRADTCNTYSITSLKSKRTIRYHPDIWSYDLPKSSRYSSTRNNKRWYQTLILDIANRKLLLDF